MHSDHLTDIPDTPLDRALALQSMLISVAENGTLNGSLYTLLRREFMDGDTKSWLPIIVITCRDEKSVWEYLKKVASGAGAWEARRSHIYTSFSPFLEYLENKNDSPSDYAISEVLTSFSAEHIHRVWERALERRYNDPEGAITTSRTLLETVCKHILDEENVSYDSNELNKLYSKTANILNLAPSQHTEQIFKAILGGCYTIVQNLGSLRNQISDAHGQGKNHVRPSPRHATLAVNLAGSMAIFMIETWNARKH